MLGYCTIGTNNVEASRIFYDGLLAVLGGKRLIDMERGSAWGNSPAGAMLVVLKPYDGKAATAGNGTMPALAAPDTETVDKVYARALELGATCDGPPGLRMPTFYGAYFRDPDGNKLCVYHMVAG